MNINEKIKQRRIKLNISDVEVANKAGLTIHEYNDIEQYSDEILTTTKLYHVKAICKILNIELIDLIDLKCFFCCEGNMFLREYLLPRNELIKKKRIEMKLSAELLGEQLGFDEETISDIENEPNYLEDWPIDYIHDLAKIIKVPFQILLNVQCKCHFQSGSYKPSQKHD